MNHIILKKKISRGSQEKKSSKEVENKMKHKAAVGRVFPKIITGWWNENFRAGLELFLGTAIDSLFP